MPPMVETIPQAPDSRLLALSDKPILDALFQKHPPAVSEMTFTNLYAWGTSHPVLLSRIKDTVLFWRGPADQGLLLAPLGELDKEGIRQAMQWSTTLGGRAQFGRVDKATADRLVAADPDLEAIEDRGSADYVYRVDALSRLSGRAFDGKRNLVKKFHNSAQVHYRPIDDALVVACGNAQAFWCDARQCSIHADLDAENQAVLVILEHWAQLGLIGGALVDADERVLAFTAAQRLSSTTAVVHLEKGDTTYKGVYQAINQAFCENALADFEFVNREQDLGVEGLRKAKQSYHPDHLVMKYTVGYRL